MAVALLSVSPAPARTTRDLSIDWLRGLAMTCVIVNHSRMSSLLSWFSYQRFWIVTAAEVFVVLSGIVIGMVYGRRLARDGWMAVARGLGRRAVMLYVVFVAVTLSVLAMSFAGIDISSLTTWDEQGAIWFLDPRLMNVAAWRDVALMKYGPWTFEIVGLYVMLVLAAIPVLIALRFAGWRPVVASSWALYLFYQFVPQRITSTEFESVFPLLAWQLLFVHGLTIGYYRESIGAVASRWPKTGLIAATAGTLAFMALAFSNPHADGPSWLRWSAVSPERFTHLYDRYFSLSDLGIGRLLNLAIALPLGYAVLKRCWTLVRPLQGIFVTLGQQSLGAFVLHVYGLLLIANLLRVDDVWVNTAAQVALIVAIAALLAALSWLRAGRRTARRAATVTPAPAFAA